MSDINISGLNSVFGFSNKAENVEKEESDFLIDFSFQNDKKEKNTEFSNGHSLSLEEKMNEYLLSKFDSPEERKAFEERNAEIRKKLESFHFQPTDPWNNKDDEIVKSTKIDDSNKLEIMKDFMILLEDDIKQFEELYEKYDAEVVITEEGEEILRFMDEEGRPVVDYIYGKEGSDDNKVRTKVSYMYLEDGSYVIKRNEEMGVGRHLSDGSVAWDGFYDNGVDYQPGYYNPDGTELTDSAKKQELHNKIITDYWGFEAL